METTKLKRFAQEARNILLTGVAQRLSTLGINRDGISEKPQVMGGGATFQGTTVSLDFVKTWESIAHNVENRGYRVVVEEAAYTWFNRLVAIRIMAKNGLIEPLLRYESDTVHIPFIVTEARHGRLPKFTAEQQAKWDAIANDDAKTDEQFMLLISAWCDNNPIIKAAFGSLDDYSSMLIPANILKDDGFVDMLNHTDYLTDEDYKSPELIGWLYQFYISERKDEVFAKKGKYDSDEIPAATQIFTPNWIVKYMVQNTVGRIYLDSLPESSKNEILNTKYFDWKYLVEPSENEKDQIPNTKHQILELEQLKVGDLACGSGHILNELFDTLYAMYLNDGYSPRNAIENILKKNIIGIDIDLRAKQLATFSLLLKECKIDKALSSAPIVPKVLVAPEPFSTVYGDVRGYFPHFFLGEPASTLFDELADCFKLMEDAKDLGSIIKFTLSDRNREILAAQVAKWESETEIPHGIELGLPYMQFILALTEKYDALAMNPPYMPTNKIDFLKRYTEKNYREGKADLFAVFMQVCMDRLCEYGRMGMINMQSWMFLSSFETLREYFISNYSLSSMLHLGPHTFDELGGEVVQNAAFVFEKVEPSTSTSGVYYRLIEGVNCGDKENMFNAMQYSPCTTTGKRYRFDNIRQNKFDDIPGAPIAYWVSEKIRETFTNNLPLSAVCKPTQGLATADNGRFVRSWFEVSRNRTGFASENSASAVASGKKWFPCNKGGGFRKWYGNQTELINWENDGAEIKNFPGAVIRNEHCYFKECIAWNMISSGGLAFRYYPKGFILNNASNCFTCPDMDEALGAFNSKYMTEIASILNPTVNLSNGVVANFPYILVKEPSYKQMVKDNVSISRADWDAHETSWDFRANEIVDLNTTDKALKILQDWRDWCELALSDVDLMHDTIPLNSIERRVQLYETKWSTLFSKLHANEEELNRRFIEIYGLEEELSPDVPVNEITILQQGEINVSSDTKLERWPGARSKMIKLNFNHEIIIKQLISYAMGCIMGRYSIDKPGLILANQGDGLEEYDEIVGESRFEVDDDGIVPLMSANLELTDNAPLRFKKWLEAAFGAENLVENLNYVQQALGKTIEAYFQKDFWKDHKKMYQNRPIYWLFTSKKGAFQCLVYMHRMDAYTPERIRTRYLLPHIDWLKRKQDELQQRASTLNTAERRELDNLTKQIAECLEYHDRLHVVADAQQPIDLDDGVVVNYAKFGDVVAKLK